MGLIKGLVYEVATDILECTAARLTAYGIDVPTRQYVHMGEVALDCCDPGQLVVTVSNLTHAMPGAGEEIAVCSPPRSVTFDVWLNRCVPTLDDNGDPPTAAELDDSAETLLTDLWTLAYVLWDGYKDGCWGGGCASVLFGPITPYGPEGACGGVHASITLNLTGVGAVGVPS